MSNSSNSNPSDPSFQQKMTKLEARLTGKSSSSFAAVIRHPSASAATVVRHPSASAATEELAGAAFSSDSDDDEGGEYLIQKYTHKRQRVQDKDFDAVQQPEVGGRVKAVETLDTRPSPEDSTRKRQGRGRGRSATGRGHVSKATDQMRLSTSSLTTSKSNGQLEHPTYKESGRDPYANDERASLQEEISILRGKVGSLENDLSKSRQEAAEHQQCCHQLEKELKGLKDSDQQMKAKKSLLETKEAIERHRKSLKKKQSEKSDESAVEAGMSEEDFLIQDEICKSRLASIKREEETVFREREHYELEKGRLIREMKRIRDEDGSRFNNFQILNHRYALMNLLGKGGFSEVYKAYDLVDYRYVACKLHGLNAQWSEEKKQSYIRHAVREYNIHKTLVHPHIVRLWDIFEIDRNTFCTVLEYCSGKDLDAVLKSTPILPEREARIVIVQIFQGLVYLNKRPQRIIHYDLKPGNVLFDEVGVAKMTDFGLSKIVEDDVGSQGMELTSQGAGTYWYLPPECFELSKTPLISSKVDVWSAGVMLYQMLFGKRPFGHDQTQERILREDTIVNARRVEFPSKPTVSNDAKELIRRCLTYNQAERPDVLTIAQDPYLSYLKR